MSGKMKINVIFSFGRKKIGLDPFRVQDGGKGGKVHDSGELRSCEILSPWGFRASADPSAHPPFPSGR